MAPAHALKCAIVLLQLFAIPVKPSLDLASLPYALPLAETPGVTVANGDSRLAADSAAEGRGGACPKEAIALFVRTFAGGEEEYREFLVATVAAFWPTLERQQLVVVLDADSTADSEMGKKIEQTWPFPEVAYSSVPEDLRSNGHVLQQEAYFFSDVYINGRARYVGMVDTDTLFSRNVEMDDVFDPVNGKPFIIAQFGAPQNKFWGNIPRITAEVLKIDAKSTLRGMSHFPVVVACAHLVQFRAHVEALHGEPFAAAWRHAWNRSRRGFNDFGAFDVIVTYLWTYHRDHYSFRLQRRGGATDRSDEFDGLIQQFPTLSTPLPRVSEHGHWRDPLKGLRFGTTPKLSPEQRNATIMATIAERDKIILRGKCLSSSCKPSSADCANYFPIQKDVGVINFDLGNALWTFEASDWRWDERANMIQDFLWPWNDCKPAVETRDRHAYSTNHVHSAEILKQPLLRPCLRALLRDEIVFRPMAGHLSMKEMSTDVVPVFVITSLKFEKQRWPSIFKLLEAANLVNHAHFIYFKSEDDSVRKGVQDCVSKNFSLAEPDYGLKRQHAVFTAIEHTVAAAALLHLDVPFALILEDDTIISDHYAVKCFGAMAKAFATARKDIGFVHLSRWEKGGGLERSISEDSSHAWHNFSWPVQCSDNSKMNFQAFRAPQSSGVGSYYANSYVITASAARVFLANYSFFERAIDHHISFMQAQGASPVDFINPPPFGHSARRKNS